MTRIFRSLLFLSLVLSACSPLSLTPDTNQPTLVHSASTTDISVIATLETPAPVIVPSPTAISTADAIGTDSGTYPRNCSYQWAQKPLPELSSSFQQSIQQLQPDAQAHAFAFGEDCIYEDGSSTFIPMETDFNVILQGGAVSDEAMGEWIVKVMQIIDSISPDLIVGPRPGRVGIVIEANGERKAASFYIDQYHALPPGLSNAEVFRALQPQQ